MQSISYNWPAIIIAEEDNVISKPLTTEDIENISNTLNKPNGVFLSAKRHNYENDKNHFTGTHFYFATQDACKAMIKNCFPIDVQTDWYIKHLGNQKEINLEGYEISNQKNRVGTSIQDSCFICNLPKNNSFYIFIIALCIVILFIFIGLIYLKNKK